MFPARLFRARQSSGPVRASQSEMLTTLLRGCEQARYARPMATLVLLRHGESVWNAEGLFTGWVDVGLSKQGMAEAEHAGELLAASGLQPRIVHTSVLARAIQTANEALDA